MSPRTIIHRWAVGLAIALAAVLAVACGSQGQFANVGTDLDAGVPAASQPAASVGRDEATGDEGGGPPAEEGLAAPIEQRIIKTGEVSVEVTDVGAAVGHVRTLALEVGGYVGGSQAGSSDESATLTLRVPAAAFDEALEGLRALEGEVVAESTRESDVTRQIIDLEARIANLEASRRRTARSSSARSGWNILAVQSRLDQVRGEIEQLNAQLQDIEGAADLSTLAVTLIPAAEPVAEVAETWDAGEQVSSASRRWWASARGCSMP